MKIHPKLNECAEENVRSVFMRPKGGVDAAEGASEHDLNGKRHISGRPNRACRFAIE